MNKQQDNQNVTLEQQLKESQLSLATSSFSTLTVEEFKQLGCRVNEQYRHSMISLYTEFGEMQELYNSFEEHSNVLQDHRAQKTLAIKAFQDMIG